MLVFERVLTFGTFVLYDEACSLLIGFITTLLVIASPIGASFANHGLALVARHWVDCNHFLMLLFARSAELRVLADRGRPLRVASLVLHVVRLAVVHLLAFYGVIAARRCVRHLAVFVADCVVASVRAVI